MAESVRRTDDVESRISKLEATVTSRIGMLEQKVDSATKATETGFEYLGKLLDQRFEASDQKNDHNNREMRQSIAFLTEQLKATVQEQSATATKVAFLETDINRNTERVKAMRETVDDLVLSKATAKELVAVEKASADKASAKDLAELKASIQWHYRAFAGALIAAVVAGAIAIADGVPNLPQ